MAIPALPTFDVSYWIKRAISKAVYLAVNPFSMFLILATSLGVVATTCVAFFAPTVLPVITIDVDFVSGNNNILQFLLYICCGDDILLLLNSVLRFIELFVPFCVTTVSSFFAIAFLWHHNKSFANMIIRRTTQA